GVRSPRPMRSRFGAAMPPTARAQLPSVFEPSSPYRAASGACPTPNESHTSSRTRSKRRPSQDFTMWVGGAARGRSRSAPLLLARDAQRGPRYGLQTFDGDGTAAPLARSVGSAIELAQR